MKRLLTAVIVPLLAAAFPRGASSQSTAVQALLRLERVQMGEAVCVLIQDDGSYRLEKLFRAKTEMYTGTMDEKRVEQLKTLLANEEFRKLSQENIHPPLITDTLDDLQFAIWRDRGWQELTFLSPASRKPFKELIDPLLRWFQDLQKQRPGAVRVEGSPTRCMPATANRLVVNTAPETPTPIAKPAVYLFRISSSHAHGARVESTCTIVFADGHFHRERTGQTYGAARQDKVVDGQLDSEALQQLKVLLEAQELKDSPGDSDIDATRLMMEGDMTSLVVPRNGKVQNLLFSSSFNTIGHPKEIGGLSNLTYHIADQSVLKPLTQWMKEHTEKPSRDETERAGNECSALTTVNSASKSK